jgi:hypothetical protein
LSEDKKSYTTVTGTTASKAPHSLPFSIEFWGAPGDEPVILKIASAYEAVTHHRKPPAAFPALPENPARVSSRVALMDAVFGRAPRCTRAAAVLLAMALSRARPRHERYGGTRLAEAAHRRTFGTNRAFSMACRTERSDPHAPHAMRHVVGDLGCSTSTTATRSMSMRRHH